MPELKNQRDLIADTDWDILVIFDACRADAFQAVTGHGRTVRSPAPNTWRWIQRSADALATKQPVYFSSNPVASRALSRHGKATREVHHLWQRHWGRFTRERVPGVHPASANGYYYALMGQGLEADVPVVMHYLPPHSPFIGEPPLNLARWGEQPDGLHAACYELRRPDEAVQAGDLSWQEIKTAYEGNLRLAWDAARQLAQACPDKQIVVTADHGECIGEDDRFGHQAAWEGEDVLHEVPWLVMGEDEPEEPSMSIEERMEALGYA